MGIDQGSTEFPQPRLDRVLVMGLFRFGHMTNRRRGRMEECLCQF